MGDWGFKGLGVRVYRGFKELITTSGPDRNHDTRSPAIPKHRLNPQDTKLKKNLNPLTETHKTNTLIPHNNDKPNNVDFNFIPPPQL